jgi:hypothetical protein
MEAYVETNLVNIHLDVNPRLTDVDRIYEIRAFLMKLVPDIDFYITVERNKVSFFLIENALLKRPFNGVRDTVIMLMAQIPEATLEIFTANRLSKSSIDRNILIKRDAVESELAMFLNAMERMDTFGIEIPRDEVPKDAEDVGEAAAEGVAVLDEIVVPKAAQPLSDVLDKWIVETLQSDVATDTLGRKLQFVDDLKGLTPGQLRRVIGIGPAAVNKMKPYL